jgi:septum formation protein
VSAPVILASKSAARRAVLAGAGAPFEAVSAGVDEDALKAVLLARGASPREIADALAEQKALAVADAGQALVIGADQTLELEGALYDKVETLEAARARLRRLRG